MNIIVPWRGPSQWAILGLLVASIQAGTFEDWNDKAAASHHWYFYDGDQPLVPWEATGGLEDSGCLVSPLNRLQEIQAGRWPAYTINQGTVREPSQEIDLSQHTWLHVSLKLDPGSDLGGGSLRFFIGEWLADTNQAVIVFDQPLQVSPAQWVTQILNVGDPGLWADAFREGSTKRAADLFEGPQQYGFGLIGADPKKLSGMLRIDQFAVLQKPWVLHGPASRTVLKGDRVSFELMLLPYARPSIQWFRNEDALAGETNSSLSFLVPDGSLSGARFWAQVSGQGITANTAEATLTLLDFEGPFETEFRYDFNDGRVPDSMRLGGSAFVATTGGVDNSGVLKLTTDANDQNGGAVISLPPSGDPERTFLLAAELWMGGGTIPQAEGLSVCLADAPLPVTLPKAEEGAGMGLTVSFDTYHSGNERTGPFADVRFEGRVIASRSLGLLLPRIEEGFAPLLMRVTEDGKLDLALGGEVIFATLAIPGLKPGEATQLGLYARTAQLYANHFVDNLRFGFRERPVIGPLRVRRQGEGNVVLEWEGAASLETTDEFPGAWRKVEGARSGFSALAKDRTRFFRLTHP